MTRLVSVAALNDFDSSFGELGLKVGPRTGPNKRTKDDKEWYILRRFLKQLAVAGRLEFPLTVQQGVPPEEPDFILKQNDHSILFEITEATSEADQREMTGIELSDQTAVLLGELGGRFKNGTSNPGPVWAADIIDAIVRKVGKAITETIGVSRHIIIYPNSNAEFLLFNRDDERAAAQCLKSIVRTRSDELARAARGCKIHVLGKEHVFLDVIGNFIVIKRVEQS